MAHSPKSVRHLLKDKPTLKMLELEISAQKALLAEIHGLLPPDLANHCVAAQRRKQQLILHVDSPVWASRLRFMATHLLAQLQPAHPELRDVRVRLLVPQSNRRTSPRSANRSDLGAAIIHESAAGTKHPELRNALERLSRTLKRQR